MQLFAYLRSFVTIVLALALVDMVQSTHRLLRARARVGWDVRPLLAAVVIFLSVLSEFFSLWGVGAIESFSFPELVGLMVTPTLLSLAALAVLPDDVPQGGLDLGEFHIGNRRYLFPVFALAVAADFIGNVRETWVSSGGMVGLDHPLWWFAAPVEGGIILICIVLAWTTIRWVHLAGLACMLAIVVLAYATWHIRLPAAPPA